MTNLDKMKEYLCRQIMGMNSEQFYDFLRETELEEYEFDFLNLDEIFTCSKCKEIYGRECCEESDVQPHCIERFKHYCEQNI